MSVAAILRSFVSVLVRTAWSGHWGWYPVVPFVVLWATYLVEAYRVVGSLAFAFLPVVGSVMMVLWLVFLIDELVEVLQANARLARAIRHVKRANLIVVAAYGLLAGLLWVNGHGEGPIVQRSAQVLAMETTRLGVVRHSWWTLRSGGPSERVERVLRLPADATNVYVGGDAELWLRQGRLSLWRVLEVRQDHEKYLLKMLEATPASRTALAGLVTLHADRRDFDKAIQWYVALTRVYPHEPDVAYDLAAALLNGRRYRQAADVFRQLVAMRRDYESLYFLGYALAWAGEKREAAKYLQEATTLDPEDDRAFYSLGYVMRDLGQYAEARAAWTRVLQLAPVFPEVQSNLRALESRMKPGQ